MQTQHRGILRANQSTLALAQRILDSGLIAVSLYVILHLHGSTLTLKFTLIILMALFLFHLFSDFNQLYTSWRGEKIRSELLRASGNWLLVCGCVALTDYLKLDIWRLPDYLLVKWFVSVPVLLCAYRVLLRKLLRHMRSLGYNSRSVAIAGAGPVGQQLANHITRAPWMGLNLVGFYDDEPTQPVPIAGSSVKLPPSGDLEQLVQEVRSGQIDRVYISLPMSCEARIRWLIKELSDSTASVYLIPDVFTFELLHARIQNINGLPSISIFDSPMDGANRYLKRASDMVIASAILCAIALPMLFIGLAVKLTSPGPVIFKQKRYGIDGRPIQVWKFRSMTVTENGSDVVQATRGDARVTPLGAFLRRTSLDELPQFINVLRGEMSIVGPRPHAVAHNEEYRRQIPGYMLRHKVKPGITGWAQINGWRGETDTLDKMQKRIEFDLDYISHWSLWLDLKIIFLTVFKGFVNKNAF